MNILAFDLGASSGTLSLVDYDRKKINMTCIHQFENYPISIGQGLYWDIIHIYHELCEGIKKAVILTGDQIVSIGCDSFCNDFALIDRDGSLLSPVRSYRDERTARCQEHTYSIMSPRELYFVNGNQMALFNTLLQMDAMKTEGQGWLLERSHKALFVSDLLLYFLSGEMITEYTTASVTQLFDYKTGGWSKEIMGKYGIRESLFAPIVMPGTLIGRTSDSAKQMLGTKGFSVYSVCQHDTASAFLASVCPDSCAIISSGTWSLVGTETDNPVITEEGFINNIANEGGYPGHHRLIKNVMGTWIIQEIIRELKKQGQEVTYSEMDKLAAKFSGTDYLIDVDQPCFFKPGQMIEKVRGFCLEYYGSVPESAEEMVSCVYTSLAMKYRYAIEILENLIDSKLPFINIVGGGSRSELLCQRTADICARTVMAGPDEAAALGNVLVQMHSGGLISSIEEGRKLIRDSFPVKTYEPHSDSHMEEMYQEFKSLLRKQKGGIF